METLSHNLNRPVAGFAQLEMLDQQAVKLVAEPVEDQDELELALPGFSDIYTAVTERMSPLLDQDPDFVMPAIFICDDDSYQKYVGKMSAEAGVVSYDASRNGIYVAADTARDMIARGGMTREHVERGLVTQLIYSGITSLSPNRKRLQTGFITLENDTPLPRDARMQGGIYFWNVATPTPEDLMHADDIPEAENYQGDPVQLHTTNNLVKLLTALHFEAAEHNPNGNDLTLGYRLAETRTTQRVTAIGAVQKAHLRELYKQQTLEQRIYSALKSGAKNAIAEQLENPLRKLKNNSLRKIARRIERYDRRPVTAEMVKEMLIPTVQRLYESLHLSNLVIDDHNPVQYDQDYDNWINLN